MSTSDRQHTHPDDSMTMRHGTAIPLAALPDQPTLPDYEDEDDSKDANQRGSNGLTPEDKRAMALLIALYCLQGVPLGLTMGSLPYLLQSKLDYAAIGVFSLASYPYSLKLFWSPVVDAVYNKQIGRRKSWILPAQTAVGLMLLAIGRNADYWVEQASTHLKFITTMFFCLVLLCATQDIAVDGWALTLLSQENLSYASTAQTIGLNTGYFASFTVFLAIQSPEFANKYFRSAADQRDVGLVTLSQYMTICGWSSLLLTAFLAFCKREKQEREKTEGVRKVYQSILAVSRLPQVQIFMLIHLIAKIGFIANDAVTNLKLLEKGLKKEDLSLAVLIDFPLEILFGYYAAKWSTGPQPLRPWLLAFQGRLVAAVLGMLLVYFMPKEVGWFYFILIVLEHVVSSFMSTVQFVSANAFHTQIADPLIGGTYMTLLNTISNLGGTWPKYFVLEGVQRFTQSECVADTAKDLVTTVIHGKLDVEKCKAAGGKVVTLKDGYYTMNIICVVLGTLTFWFFIRDRVTHLQGLNLRTWRVHQ